MAELGPEDAWLAAWRDVPRCTKNAYANLYSHAARDMKWGVTVGDADRGVIHIHAPGRKPFEIRKHHVDCLYDKVSVAICKDKKLTHELLLQHGFPCPRSVFVRRATEFRRSSVGLCAERVRAPRGLGAAGAAGGG